MDADICHDDCDQSTMRYIPDNTPSSPAHRVVSQSQEMEAPP